MRKFSSLLLVALACLSVHAQTRYVGGDISMLPKYEKYNSAYKDAYGNDISDLLTWFKTACKWNTFRVRIFVNPIGMAKGKADPSVCQDLAYVTALGKRIKDAGAYFMLDFHYSDEWVDATHIQAPVAWKGKSDAAMADSVGAYTRRVLTALNAAGATPDLVQVGNEIMYGLCGISVHPYYNSSDNWTGYLGLLKAGCNAVREVCPEAKIIIHTDHPTNQQYNYYYYNKLRTNDVDFDIIGLSYYPFWHAGVTPDANTKAETVLMPLINAINVLKTQFPEKRVQIVEFAYNFQWWPSSDVNYDTQKLWECSTKGQYIFVKDFVDKLKPLENLDGINYWFPEEAGNGDKGTVISDWLNRGFWNEEKTTAGHMINTRTGGKASSVLPPKLICAPYYMGTFYNAAQAIDEVENERTETDGRKILRDGRLLIERAGVLYGPDGSRQ